MSRTGRLKAKRSGRTHGTSGRETSAAGRWPPGRAAAEAASRAERSGPYAASSPGRSSWARSSASACSAWPPSSCCTCSIDVPKGNAATAAAQQQSNVYKYSDGKTSSPAPASQPRDRRTSTEVPKDVQHAFVAAENKTFYNDAGVDFKGTARGLINTLSGKGKQGGSTITQQYVKNYYLDQDQTVTRKLKELVISLKVDRQKSKDDILAGYINTSYYGRGAYGIQAAAQAYYRVDAEQTDRRAGRLPRRAAPGPEPVRLGGRDRHRQGSWSQQRWNYVLDNMVEEDWLDPAERDDMKFPSPRRPRARRAWKARPAISSRPPTGSWSSSSSPRAGHRRGRGRGVGRPGRLDHHAEHRQEEAGAAGEGRQAAAHQQARPPRSARSTPTSRPAPSPSTRRRARSSRCTAAWTT